MTEAIFALLYFAIRELSSAGLFYYIFGPYVRINRWLNYAVLCLGVFLEWGVYLYQGNFISIAQQYAFAFSYAVYAFVIVRATLSKQLLIVLICAHLAMLSQTLALVAWSQYTWPVPQVFIITPILFSCYAILYPALYYFFRRYKEPFLKTNFLTTIRLADVVLLLEFLGVIAIYDFQSTRDWYVFWGRSFLSVPSLLFMLVIITLLKEERIGYTNTLRLSQLTTLRNTEQKYFQFVLDSWDNARCLRHDLRHLALLLLEYLSEKNYLGIDNTLNKLLERTSRFKAVELTGNETIDGLVGYWQLEAWKNEIEFTRHIDIEQIHINDVDLAIVLNTLLKQICLAAQKNKLQEQCDAKIAFKLTTKKELLLLAVELTPASQKPDVEAIRPILDIYSGIYTCTLEGQQSVVKVALQNLHKEEMQDANS